MRLVTLPGDLAVWTPSAFEARVLYREIFVDRGYFDHDIAIGDGATVFDVGANIGLFSICLTRAHRDLRLFLFEPIPVTFEAARRNMALHAGSAEVTLLPYGLAAEAGHATFEYDRYGAMAATMRRADVIASIRAASLRDWGVATIHDFEWSGHLSPRAAARLRWAFATPGPSLVARAVLRLLMLYVDLRRRMVLQRPVCELRTLSEAIVEHGVRTIDLLKIDVEGSELEVVRGIAQGDWPKIRQLVIEIHNVAGRAEAVAALLRGLGYRVTVDVPRSQVAAVLGVVVLYAVLEP